MYSLLLDWIGVVDPSFLAFCLRVRESLPLIYREGNPRENVSCDNLMLRHYHVPRTTTVGVDREGTDTKELQT